MCRHGVLLLVLLLGVARVESGAAQGQGTPETLTIDALVTHALADNPDLRAARAEVEAARGRLLQAGLRPNPMLDLGAQRSVTGPDNNLFHYVGGGVTVMLPVRNRNQGNIAAAFAEAQAAEHREALAVLTVRQEAQAALTQYEAAVRALEIYAQGVREVARGNLEVIRKAYQLGRTTLLEVIAEQRRYMDIERGYTEALQHVYNAGVDIERALGTVSW